jgi:ribosomal protein S4
MKYPGYLLNPGDMFQVEPERVMFGTGEKKETIRRQRIALRKAKADPSAIQSHEDWLAPEIEDVPEEGAAESDKSPESLESSELSESSERNHRPANTSDRKDLKMLLASAKDILSNSKEDLSGRAKQDLRRFRTMVKKLLSKKWPTDPSTTAGKVHAQNVEDLDIAFQALKVRLFPAKEPQPAASESTSETSSAQAEQEALLREALQRARENPIDDSKPYATPWRPRPYMNAFAFIPRYLEVNQKVCAAVYLRHPVARPGLAEVPTPFAQETSQLAFNWYLRRR